MGSFLRPLWEGKQLSNRVVCHEASPEYRRCPTVREMKGRQVDPQVKVVGLVPLQGALAQRRPAELKLNYGFRRNLPRAHWLSCACFYHHGGGAMHFDRVHADRYLAFLGFALSFLFLLAIVAFAFTVESAVKSPQSVSQAVPK